MHNEIPIDTRKDCGIYTGFVPVDQNQSFPYNHSSTVIDNRQGVLTNWLTISKNTSTPTGYWIDPHCIPIIIKKDAKLTLDNSIQFEIKTNTGGTMSVNIEDDGILLLKNYSNMIFNSNTELDNKLGGIIGLTPNSTIHMKDYSIFCNQGSIMGAGKVYFERRVLRCANQISEMVIDSTEFEFQDSSVVEIPDSTNMIFKHGTLKINPHSTIVFGKNSKITIKDGAYIDVDSCTFTSDTSTTLAGGIVLENAGSDTKITNCSFSNCKTAISIKNDADYGWRDKIISNNIFNVPVGADYGVYCENVQNILLKGNQFNVNSSNTTAVGLYVKNSAYAASEIVELGPLGEGSDGYGLHILNNSFSGGLASAVIANYISAAPNCYISSNTFTSASGISFVGRLISGYFKNNTFDNSDAKAVFLYQSNPHFFGNTFNGNETNVILAGDSYPNLAPQTSDGTSYWRGGNNIFTSGSNDNLLIDIGGGGIFANYGNNSFAVGDVNDFNIYGQVTSTFDTLFCRENAFMPSYSPISYAWMNTNDPVAVIGTTNYNVSFPSFSSSLRELGYGVIDTLFTTSAVGTTSSPEDEEIYTQAVNQKEQGLYLDAIITYKSLINNFPESDYLGAALTNIFKTYQALDTTYDQNFRDYLYGDLKLYLEDKIGTGDYRDAGSFETDAYYIVLICESEIDPYAAIEGYELVAQFHPDPTMRLLASWDAAELEDLMNQGNGGGHRESKGKMKLSRYEIKRIKDLNKNEMLRSKKDFEKILRINEIENREPVKETMKKVYKKIESKNDKMSKQLKDASLSKDLRVVKSNQKKEALLKSTLDGKFSDRAANNLRSSRLLNKEEKGKRQLEDLLLIAGVKKGGNSIETDNAGIVSAYSLAQNYPNPFNPSTKINYEIKTAGFVSLKIYDLLGREIAELVNEAKDAGRYTVDFNAGKYMMASGIYFYRIKSGDFVDTKRMVLVK